MRSFGSLGKAAVALCLFQGVALADTVKYTVTFEPAKQGGPGSGTATFSLDTASKTLTGTIEYSGVAPPAMAEFEGPPPKQGGQPVEVPVPLPASTASPIHISMKLTDPVIAGLKSGDWVLLLGTKQAPEIGGDVKPAQ